MRYELGRLGPDGFEHLIQSLIRGLFGMPAIVFGDGPDGQREAVIKDASVTAYSGIVAHGRVVVQAKFKDPDTKTKDWDWLRKNLKDELDGFKKKSKTHPQMVPDTFLFYTNMVLTPVLDKGTRDRAEKFAAQYKDVIPNILIFGADDVRTMLDNNRDVARCYASFIMPGDVLMELRENLKALSNEKFEDLVEYARQMFREDSAVRLEQAGSIASKSINIRNVYTDLEAKGPEREINQIAAYIIDLGNRVHKIDSEAADAPGRDFRKLPQRAPENNIVLIGNAGQGKSTLCQYICQIYRAALLRRFRKNEPETQDYLAQDALSSLLVPRCERFPVLINLKRYAAWINKQQAESSRSVIAYILSCINGRANAALSIHDFRRLLSGYSWVFLFDGLDELPASSNRNEVLKQIQEFLEKDLVDASCDNLVICTSRPQGYDDAFSVRWYHHYELKDMSESLCKSYIEKLLTYLEENSDQREHYRGILYNALADPMVSKLMTTPLYTAIIVLLVKMGGTPPTKRYSLFKEYCDIVIKREQQKEMLPMIHDDCAWIIELHAQIGFLLQTESETAENAAAELPAERCKELIVQFLRNEEVEDDLAAQSEALYRAMTNRLLFLSEVSGSDSEPCVTFPLRSIQEYFAAEWLISFDNEDDLSDALEIISASGYWRNVYLFVAGFFAKNRNRRNMNETLFRICQRNNGDENHKSQNTEVYRIAMQGSRLALDLLCDNLFNKPDDQRRYLGIAAKLLDWDDNILPVTQRFLHLPPKVADLFLQEKVIPHIQTTKSADGIAFNYLWAMANRGNEKARAALEEIVGDVKVPGSPTIRRWLTSGFRGAGEKTLFTVYRWITEERFEDFCYPYLADDVYGDFLTAYLTRSKIEAFPAMALRQIAYRMLQGVPFRNSVFRKGSVFGAHPLLRVLAEAKDLKMRAFSRRIEAALPLVYSPIQRDRNKLPLLEYAKKFRAFQLEELAVLMEFLHSPSYPGLKKLLEEYRKLPEVCQEAFAQVMEQYNWLLREIGGQLDGFEDVDDLLAHYNSAHVETCLQKDNAIAALVEADDVASITKLDYWNEISLPYGETIPQDALRMVLNNVSETNISEGLLSFLSRAIDPEEPFPPECLQFCINHYPLLFERRQGIVLGLRAFREISLARLLSGDIKYPKTLWAIWPYCGIKEEEAVELSEKIDSLVGIDEGTLQAYALLPHVFAKAGPGSLAKIPPDTIMRYYHVIHATGNRVALLGCILRLLAGPVPEEYTGEVWEELLGLLQMESLGYMWYEVAESFSLEGKMLVYKGVKELDTEMAWGNDLIAKYAATILEEVEASPIDRDELKKLSETAHSN